MNTLSFAILATILTACGPPATIEQSGSAKSPEQTGNRLPRAEDEIRALSAKYPQKTVALLLRRMQAKLPKGWRASYEKEYSVLEISRDEAVLATRIVINGSGDEKPERTECVFAFRVKPVVSADEYRRLDAENAGIQGELNTLYEELVKKRVSQKFDSFVGVTDEDKVVVARFNALKKSRHRLPDYYFEEISLEWIYGRLDNSLWGPDIYIEDERIREECTQTQKKLLSLFSKYEGA